MIDEKVLYQNARRKVRRIKGFLNHLFSYLIVNLILFIANYLNNPDDLWVIWAVVIWGMFVLMHFFRVFITPGFLGREWEDRKIKDYMAKERERLERQDGRL